MIMMTKRFEVDGLIHKQQASEMIRLGMTGLIPDSFYDV